MKTFNRSQFVCSALLMLGFSLSLVGTADAKLLNSQKAEQGKKAEDIASPSDIRPAQAIAPIPAAEPVPLEENGLVSSNCQKCGDRCIKYRNHVTLRKTCKCCEAPQETILEVKDPCCCCTVEIPVCLPGCCKDAPKVCSGSGIFGRNIVEYEWCCGYRLKIVFDRCGDITVHSYGR